MLDYVRVINYHIIIIRFLSHSTCWALVHADDLRWPGFKSTSGREFSVGWTNGRYAMRLISRTGTVTSLNGDRFRLWSYDITAGYKCAYNNNNNIIITFWICEKVSRSAIFTDAKGMHPISPLDPPLTVMEWIYQLRYTCKFNTLVLNRFFLRVSELSFRLAICHSDIRSCEVSGTCHLFWEWGTTLRAWSVFNNSQQIHNKSNKCRLHWSYSWGCAPELVCRFIGRCQSLFVNARPKRIKSRLPSSTRDKVLHNN